MAASAESEISESRQIAQKPTAIPSVFFYLVQDDCKFARRHYH